MIGTLHALYMGSVPLLQDFRRAVRIRVVHFGKDNAPSGHGVRADGQP